MGLDVVLNEILARGSEEEHRILREAEEERKRILDAARLEADAIQARIRQDAENRVQALEREQVSAAEFEARRRLLQAQRELTEDFRQRVLDALNRVPKAQSEKALKALFERVKGDVPEGRIHAPKDALAFLSKATKYDRGDALQGVGGFQLESADGAILLDCRYETLLDATWKRILAQSRDLFEA